MEEYYNLKCDYSDFLVLTNPTQIKNRANNLRLKHIDLYVYIRIHELKIKKGNETEDFTDDSISETEKRIQEINSILVDLTSKAKETRSKDSDFHNGLVAVVNYSNSKVDEEAKFFIKAHQNGATSNTNATSKPVNLFELFVYKSLESVSTLLKPKDLTKPIRFEFKLANIYNADKDEANNLCRNLCNEQFIENLKCELTFVDIISRIFGLTDCSTNSENYGFLVKPQNALASSIIDFRTYDYPPQKIRGLFKDFLHRNTRFQYSNKSLMHDVIVADNVAVKISRAILVLEKFKKDFDEKIDASVLEVEEFIVNCGDQQLHSFFNDAHKLINLNKYAKHIKKCFKTFLDKLYNYSC